MSKLKEYYFRFPLRKTWHTVKAENKNHARHLAVKGTTYKDKDVLFRKTKPTK
jgi:hypothetical protein